MNAEFKKGDKVEIVFGWLIWNLNGKKGMSDLCPSDVGRKAVIEYSYKDRFEKEFGYSEGDENKFSLKFEDTGYTASWYSPFQLKHID